VSKFEPTTDLENEMHEVLRQAGATEDDVRKFEELELNKLTLEQAQKRQGELARMRVLLMRQEEKARRHAKIKSKSVSPLGAPRQGARGREAGRRRAEARSRRRSSARRSSSLSARTCARRRSTPRAPSGCSSR
jgi:hypothetical protein